MVYVSIVLLGLAFGSFTNALAWRVYEQNRKTNKKSKGDLSVTRGRSMCVHCNHTLSSLDLIPVFSWFWLKGRCRYCKKPISWHYPLVELLFMFALLFLYLLWPVVVSGWQWVLFALWLPMLVCGFALAIIDIQHQLLPNRLMYPLGVLSLSYALLSALIQNDIHVLVSSAIGSLALFAFFYSIYQISKGRWIGGGDVRLVAVIGLLLGWQKGLLSILVASYLAVAVIFVLIILRKYHKKMLIAFGPFLFLATYLVFLYGDIAIDYYRSITGL